MKAIIQILKTVGLISAMLGGLVLLGNTINQYLPWEWLTSFFIIIRKTILLLDFIIDTDTLFIIVGYALTIQISIWIFEAIYWLINQYKK